MATKKKTTQAARPAADDNWQIADIPIADVKFNPDYQMRAEPRSSDEYYGLLVDGEGKWPFPPIKCCEIRGVLVCVDGFTRGQAALDYVEKNAAGGAYEIPVSYRKSTAKEALIEALKSNADHGYRRTNADKRNAVLRAIGAMPNASAHKIAEACRVSHTYVYNIKTQIVTESTAPTPEQVNDVAAEHEANAEAEAAHQEQVTAAEAKQKELGTCPNCKAKGRWIERDDGWSCADCLHPHGEPAGDIDEPSQPQTPAPAVQDSVTVDETTPAGFDLVEEQPAEGPAPTKSTGAMVDLRADKIKKAKAAVGVIVRVADDLGITDSIKDAIEAIQAKLAEG